MHPKYKEAVALHRTGQVKKAKGICLKILEDEPKNFDILYLLGIISFQLKDYKKSSELIYFKKIFNNHASNVGRKLWARDGLGMMN